MIAFEKTRSKSTPSGQGASNNQRFTKIQHCNGSTNVHSPFFYLFYIKSERKIYFEQIKPKRFVILFANPFYAI